MTATATDTDKTADRYTGELYRDDAGNEVWRIKEIATGEIARDGIASDGDYRWLLDCMNHDCDYADLQEARRDEAAGARPWPAS
jgi:hypothetical protein